MKYLSSWKMFESVDRELSDILLEINDETFWKAECWSESGYFTWLPDSRSQKWVVVIQTIDEDEEYELESLTPPTSVIETIERSIDFMDSEGFTNYQMTYEKDGRDQYEDDQIVEITLDELSSIDIWPNKFIRIEFWK